ncbi:MAG: hypothetical protein PHP06_01210 [Clostridia bacterium]|nr:hypothetical protein [Clostridia bacterium]
MNVENSIPLIIGICSMGFVGIVDDLVGNRRTTGLRGHFSKFIKGDFTTGTFKAIICLLISIIISSTLSKGYIDLILNILVICLSTNLINIFDVRPGRAVKVVLFLCTIFLLIEISLLYLATPLICMLGVYGNYDVKSYCMMGDTGSNILGFILGFFSISHFDFLTKITYLIFLIIIHIVAERYSITDIINHHRVLSFIDKIGSIRQN